MFTSQDIDPGLTGECLKEAMKASISKREILAEGFLYEQTILMIAADPGIGKSPISTQVAIELAAGLPVFGVFRPLRPLKVLYIQTERNIIEFLERMDTISRVLPILYDNLVITDNYQRFNLLNYAHTQLFLECVKRDCPNVDVIFIDPIYPLVSGGLKDDTPASAFTKAMSRLQKETKAMLWYNHHTTKAIYTSKGDVIDKEDPFYGSQWLKAHVTGSYHMKKHDSGVKMIRKKDNYSLLPEEITLEYNPETELCFIPLEEMPAIERVRTFLNAKKVEGKEFYFNDLSLATKLCHRTLRRLLCHSSISSKISVVSSKRNKNLYKIVEDKKSCAVPLPSI